MHLIYLLQLIYIAVLLFFNTFSALFPDKKTARPLTIANGMNWKSVRLTQYFINNPSKANNVQMKAEFVVFGFKSNFKSDSWIIVS